MKCKTLIIVKFRSLYFTSDMMCISRDVPQQVKARHSKARHSKARHSKVRHGKAKHSKTKHSTTRHSNARHCEASGIASQDIARPGKTRQGKAQQSIARHSTCNASHHHAGEGTSLLQPCSKYGYIERAPHSYSHAVNTATQRGHLTPTAMH